MPTIKYNKLWRKVRPENIIPGRAFTTCRGYEPRKESYYRSLIGKEITQEVNGLPVGTATLEGIETCRVNEKSVSFWKEDTLPEWEMEDVCGFMEKMYSNFNPIVLVLKLRWIKRINQTRLG